MAPSVGCPSPTQQTCRPRLVARCAWHGGVTMGPPKRGPKRIDQRAALNAVIFRLRSGCQWNPLPKEYPDDSSVHRTFQRWIGLGIFDRIWAMVQEACEDLGGCDWEWQAADTSMGKARMGGTSSARARPT